MRDEYDFSKAERGKFFSPNAEFQLPLYLEKEVMAYFSEKAQAKGVPVNELLNDLLKKEIELIKSIV